jgi:hypothetical protein
MAQPLLDRVGRDSPLPAACLTLIAPFWPTTVPSCITSTKSPRARQTERTIINEPQEQRD